MLGEIDLNERDGDAVIRGLFRDWQAAMRIESPDDDEALTRKVEEIAALGRRIRGTAASGPVGLAIKAYLAAHWESGMTREDACAIRVSYTNTGFLDSGHLQGLIAEAARFPPAEDRNGGDTLAAGASGDLRPGDAALIKLFREWRAALSAVDDEPGLASEVFEQRMDRLIEIEHQIAAAPAETAAGLSIKSYLAAHNERGPDGEVRNRSLLSLVEHGPRFVAELAPFADKILAASLGDDENEDEPVDGQAELRARAEALAAEYSGALPSGDAGLIEAERRQRALEAGMTALSREFDVDATTEEEILTPIVGEAETRYYLFIGDAEPETLAGVAVKLRWVRRQNDPEMGAGFVLGQCLDAIEREIAVAGVRP